MTLAFPAARAALATLAVSCFVSLPAAAAQIVIPQSALTPSTEYYTDQIGGGIGEVVVMTGGGNAAGVGVVTGRNDDGFRGPIGLGYTLDFFGETYTQFFANNNGNMSFNSGISAFVPTGPTGANAPVISPWFGDVDTRNASSGVLHLRDDIANQTILTWDNVGRYNSQGNLLNSFQLVVRGPEYDVPVGEGQIGFFYKQMPWEQTGTSTTAAVGFGNGAGDSVVLEGSTVAGLNTVVANHHIWFNQNLEPIPPVTAVPEPETYAMLLAGLGLIGAITRRRQRRLAAD